MGERTWGKRHGGPGGERQGHSRPSSQLWGLQPHAFACLGPDPPGPGEADVQARPRAESDVMQGWRVWGFPPPHGEPTVGSGEAVLDVMEPLEGRARL